jgi:hypothetical protein
VAVCGGHPNAFRSVAPVELAASLVAVAQQLHLDCHDRVAASAPWMMDPTSPRSLCGLCLDMYFIAAVASLSLFFVAVEVSITLCHIHDRNTNEGFNISRQQFFAPHEAKSNALRRINISKGWNQNHTGTWLTQQNRTSEKERGTEHLQS